MENSLGAFSADQQSPRGVVTAAAPTPAHAIPESIGSYRIIDRLGEGGMGTVYKAEQRDPVRRLVALKIIKLGMDTKEVLARFDVERQALALMSHPNVAKVFDAGLTDAGRPYFVMELVSGVSITSYCDTNKLTTLERIELFLPVCHAVQHAHQKGIIHRDLKPGNILITLQDGKPTAKVIDFGVAKATSFQLTDKTLFTQSGSIVGTIEYMSPEQAATSGIDVDTRTDIYSLGVILYELLSGALPFESETLRGAGYEKMVRIIQDTDPPKPSTRLRSATTTVGGDDPTVIARRHRSDPHSLSRELRGDLDWIVLKAMEKDRTRRYESADAFALDLARFLKHEPVLARPPSNLYRLRKFARRHTGAIAAGAALILLLVIGAVATAYSIVQRNVAQTERAARESASQSAERIGSLFESSLALFNSSGFTKNARETQDELARRLDEKAIDKDPIVEERVRNTLGQNYMAMGLYDRAIHEFHVGLELTQRLHGETDPACVGRLNELADALLVTNDVAGAEQSASAALHIEQTNLLPDPVAKSWTLDLIGSVHAARDDWQNAEIFYQQASELRLQQSKDTREYADSIAHRAEVLLHHDPQSKEGVTLLSEARLRYERAFLGQPYGFAMARYRLLARGATRRDDWRSADSFFQTEPDLADLSFFREREQVQTKLLESDSRNLALWARRGHIRGRLGNFDAALDDYRKALAIQPNRARTWHMALALMLGQGHLEEYKVRRAEVLRRFDPPEDPKDFGPSHQIPKCCLALAIDGDELRIALKMADLALHNDRSPDAFDYQAMGMADYRAGKWDDAIANLSRSCDHVYAYRNALSQFYLAMTWQSRRDHQRAAAAFVAGNTLWESAIPKPGVEDLQQFEDWLLCRAARDEAQVALNGGNSMSRD